MHESLELNSCEPCRSLVKNTETTFDLISSIKERASKLSGGESKMPVLSWADLERTSLLVDGKVLRIEALRSGLARLYHDCAHDLHQLIHNKRMQLSFCQFPPRIVRVIYVERLVALRGVIRTVHVL